MIASDIIALDLGTRTGFAIGAPGRLAESGTVVLKREGQDASIAFSNLLAFLVVRFDAGRPRFLAKEAPLPLAPSVNAGIGGATFRLAYGLHAVVEAVCVRFGTPFYEEAESTIRKHFTGRGRWGARNAGKAAAVRRCHQLGYMDRGDADNDRADACAVWDWACATLAKAAPRELVLFPPAESGQALANLGRAARRRAR